MMELPPMRMPRWGNLFTKTALRIRCIWARRSRSS
jgi:Fe2+ transport system protein B